MISRHVRSTKKRDGTRKGRMRSNSFTQRSCIPKKEASIPTTTTESVIITSVTGSKQERDVMSTDIPNAFAQTKVPKGDKRTTMNIRGALACMLLDISPQNTKTSKL